jgi:1-aminocyclopropane-1-carboxylate deaminase/D-cysteine desulfhydrase-like pyridoxal-dependent ACC family enzyme
MARGTSSSRPLFNRCPEARKTWIALAELPTPLEPLSSLGASVGLPALWIKRDDLTSSLYGGNKVRKLEFLLGEAVGRGARTLVTVGATGSHHVLATARFGHQLDLATTAVVTPQAPSPHAERNRQLGEQWGVAYVPCPHPVWLPGLVAHAMATRRGAFFIPPGGSSTLGALGYVNAALEFAEQIRQGAMPPPAAIVVATGSAGTHAGLVIGLGLAGLDIPVVGVRVVPRLYMNEAIVAGLIVATAWRLGWRINPGWALGRVHLRHDQFGAGYGISTPRAEALTADARRLEGLSLEGTYTAKALAGAVAIGQALGHEKPLLFWHTYAGDQPVSDAPALAVPLAQQAGAALP